MVYVLSSVGVGAPNTFQSWGALTVGGVEEEEDEEDEEEEDEEALAALRLCIRSCLSFDDCALFFTVVDWCFDRVVLRGDA